MANSLYNLALDFSKELNYTKAIMARQGDKGITVTVKPFLNGLQMDTSGGTFTLKGTTPSNRYVDSVATSVTSEEVTFSLDGTFMSEAGYYKHCYVEYRKGDQILTTQDITFFSLGVSDISQGQADEYVSQLEELIRKYNETFDAFMAEIESRVDSLNKQITDLTGQAKTLQDKLDALKEEISKLGNLQVMYSNSTDFGDYDYSGNPNIAPNVGFNDFYNNGSQTGYTAKDGVDHIAVTKTADASPAGKLVNLRTLLPNKTYTLSVDVWADMELPSGAISCGIQLKEGTQVRNVWVVIGKPVSTNRTTYSVTFTTAANFVTTEESRITFWFGKSAGACTGYLGYNIKIEEGSTATPYQPNLLDAPYYLSKVALGENILKPASFPINTTEYMVTRFALNEPYVAGQTYTFTMKATKPATQYFAPHLRDGVIGVGEMTPVAGLTDVWQITYTVTQEYIDSGANAINIFQMPQSTKGTVTIEWAKLEKGDTRTPNIEQYKYQGIGMRDSNNPKDYVWNLAPKYVEDNLTTDTKISEIVSQANKYTDGKASEINSQLTVAINAVDEKATNNTADLTNQVNNNKVLIQKNKDRIIGGYRVNDLMRKTHYSAHRGNNADFPENSSMAMKKVIRHKFSECDVQTTSDGKWVVMHDATVDRMTNGTGRVDSFTYEELRKLRIDTGNNLATLPDWEKVIPNLDEAIKYNRMAGTIPMIEIKVDEGTTYTDEELADFVNQLKLNNLDKGGCIVISFSADVLRKLRSLSETLEIMWVTYDMSDATLNTCKELRMHVDPQYSHETVTRSQIQKYHDNGLLVSVWTCPDDKFADMEDRGVDIITTNSRSGDLKWGKLTLKNGFTGVTWAGYLPPCVEEITKGILRVSCTVLNGSNTQNTVIAEFPSWAQPYLNSAGLGMVRTTSTIEQCSVDVIGKIAGTPSLVVGLNWNNRTSWAMINIDYKIL
ncbi:hypothetical protein KWN52_000335 [Enterococcus hirae]|nr:hypothetical protein [Enterococcus hirae]